MRITRYLIPGVAVASLVYAVGAVVLWQIPFSVHAEFPAPTLRSGPTETFLPPEEYEVAEPEPEIPAEEIIETDIAIEHDIVLQDVDNDTAYEEAAGDDGLTDAPFGVSANVVIGLGGGSGGRGGRYRLRARGHHGVTENSTEFSLRTWKRSRLVPHTTKLEVGDDEALPLEKMQVKVRVDGFRARVVLDCFFRNDRDRTLEGTFKLRLPDEASPFFLAFGEMARVAGTVGKIDVSDDFEPEAIVRSRRGWSEPKIARMVPRAKAARAYTETVRRRVDPALLEWAGAGVYNARVFPLQPGKLHRIVVAYDVTLTEIGNDLEYRLQLPEKIPALDVDLRVDGLDAEVQPGPATCCGTYSYRNPTARTFVVRIKDPGAVLLRGADPATGPFFAARVRPALPAVAVPGHRRAVFLVDTSLSSNPDRFNVWLRLLRAILENNRDSLREFAVVCFNVERFRWRDGFATNSAKNTDEVMEFLRGLALEGATDLAGALSAVAREDADVFLLSDGAATWGPGALPAVQGALFAYTTGFQGTDTLALRRIARASGGAVFTVAGAAEVSAASTAHRKRPWRIRNISIEGGSDLLVTGRPQTIFPGQTLTLAGRGRPARGTATTLHLQQGDETREVRLGFDHVLETPLAPRVYGEIAVEQLEEETDENAKAYAIHFRVPGRTCSLLMLESERDYQRFGIVPEETAFAVKAQPVNEILGRRAPATNKTRLCARLTALEKLRGLNCDISQPLRILLDRMPEGAFAVQPEQFACAEREMLSIPGGVQEQLAAHELRYGTLQAEANRRHGKRDSAGAVRALSSLIEENPGDAVLARDVGYSTLQLGFPGHAYHLFRRVADTRPYEPQSYVALAESLEELGNDPLALLYHEIVLSVRWRGRGAGARRQIAAYLRLLARLVANNEESPLKSYATARLEGIRREFDAGPADLVVSMAWNTDGTDVDLHVTDPAGEECNYKHRHTRAGGTLTEDVTGGFGPETFTLKKASRGEYLVRTHYFNADENRLTTRTRVYVTIIKYRSTAREEVIHKVVTLKQKKQMQVIARIKLGTD